MLCQFQVNNKVTQLHIYLFVCGYTYIHTHTYSFSDSPPLQVITRYWIQLPVLYSGSLLFLFYTLQCVCVSSVPKSCPTLCNPIDYSPQGIFPSRIRERVVISYSRGSSQPRGRTQVSYSSGIEGRLFAAEVDALIRIIYNSLGTRTQLPLIPRGFHCLLHLSNWLRDLHTKTRQPLTHQFDTVNLVLSSPWDRVPRV